MAKRYKGLCISSGGYKGFGILGALGCFDRNDLLSDVRKYAGCSIGSVINTLLVCGWSPIEIYKSSVTTNLLSDFESINIKGFAEKLGLISNERIREQLEELVLVKRRKIPTLLELHNDGYYIAYSVCNKSTKRGVKIDYKNHPTLLCTDAALMSSNIPPLFPPISFDGMQVVDGALTNPFPINYIDNGENDILGIVVYGNSDKPPTLIEYIFEIVMIEIEELQRITVKNCSPKVDVLEMRVNDLSYFNSKHSFKIKNRMFFHGWRDGEYLVKALRKRHRRHSKKSKLKELHEEESEDLEEVKLPVFDIPDDVILKCLMSQPSDLLCQISVKNPEAIQKCFKLLEHKVREKWKILARVLIEDEIKSGIHVRVEPSSSRRESDSENIKVRENYSQTIYENLPNDIKHTAKAVINSLNPQDAGRMLSGVNIIVEGLRTLGIDIFQGFLLSSSSHSNEPRRNQQGSERIEELDDDYQEEIRENPNMVVD